MMTELGNQTKIFGYFYKKVKKIMITYEIICLLSSYIKLI